MADDLVATQAYLGSGYNKGTIRRSTLQSVSSCQHRLQIIFAVCFQDGQAPTFRPLAPKLAVQGRYNLSLYLCVSSCSLQGVAERPLPCNYNVIFHGGNTGSNPVGDAKPFQELTGSGHFWRRHKKAQLRRDFWPGLPNRQFFRAPRAVLVGTKRHIQIQSDQAAETAGARKRRMTLL